MKTKVRNAVKSITAVLSEWPGVEAVVLQQFADKDIFDPGFSITLDVFRDGPVPAEDERREAFPYASYFEASQSKAKDRFMVDELPVRISYKDRSRVDAVLDAAGSGGNWLSMERGTYLFHRIATGTVQWAKGDWLDAVLSRLDELPDSFWEGWLGSCHRRLDHYLGDLVAAAIKDDQFYFRLSLSGFLGVAAETLFAVNRVFEPGPRDVTATLAVLDEKPDGFEANWDSLLREDAELTVDRKKEVGTLLAKSLFSYRD